MCTKGVASVRRSSPEFQRALFSALQDAFIKETDYGSRVPRIIFDELKRLLDGRYSVREFVRTCQLKGPYDSPQPQQVVCDKIAKRRPGAEPRPGDRVEICMAQLPDVHAKAWEMAEDPAFMEQNDVPVALYYYISTTRTCVEQLVETVFGPDSMDLKRVELLFDQAEDIAEAQATRRCSIQAQVLDGFWDPGALARAPPSREGQRRSRKTRLAQMHQQTLERQQMIPKYQKFWSASGFIAPQEPKEEKKELQVQKKEFFKALKKQERKRERKIEDHKETLRAFFNQPPKKP